MNLLDIFLPRSQNVSQTASASQIGNASAWEKSYRAQSEIRNMVPGQTIQGEVVAKDGNTVQIALDSDVILTARLDREMNIMLGQSMSFEVKTNSNSLLSLSPLYSNMANEATILKALSAAGLTANADNMKMVSVMMQEGMSIDRDSIAAVNRQLADFPGANPESVVQMMRLGLPINEINLEQFEMYKNYEHQIVQSAEQIMEELPQTYQELLAEGRDSEAVSFYGQIIRALLGGEAADEAAEGMQGLEDAVQSGADKAQASQEGLPVETTPDSRGAVSPEEASGTENAREAAGKEIAVQASADGLQEIAGQEDNAAQAGTEAKEAPASPMSSPMWRELGEMFRKLGADAELTKQVSQGELPEKEVLSQINKMLTAHSNVIHEDFQSAVKELFGTKSFQNLLQTEMTNQWLLKPEEVADKRNIEQLYERIREQTQKISEAFQMVDKTGSPAAKSVQNLQNNVDFMNQMNQMFTYVQLPLKMMGNQAHGDLYVYTNKKNLAKKDGTVSALLHLDMEHLGPMDVYISMQKELNKVNTNFTLKDESALDLIAEHIHMLDERLEKRGYNMKASFHLKDENEPEETNVMQEILAQNKNISMLSMTSFDMRA